MKDSRVERFNVVTGKAPSKNINELYKQIENQCTYLLEEVKETLQAAKENNMIEVVDGVCDIKYVASQLQTLVESIGVDFEGAFSEVCNNNDKKFTTIYNQACAWEGYYAEQNKDVYISHVKYKGEDYFTVCDAATNKTLKFNNFPKVDLIPFLPKELVHV